MPTLYWWGLFYAGGRGIINRKADPSIVLAAIDGLPNIDSLLGAAGVGSSFGRTIVLARWFRNQSEPSPGALVEGAIIGGTIGLLVVLGVGLLGARSLPDWTYVPTVVVAVQVGFSRVLDRVLAKRLGPLDHTPLDPTYEQVAFTLFGAVTLPGLVIFILTMTLVSVL